LADLVLHDHDAGSHAGLCGNWRFEMAHSSQTATADVRSIRQLKVDRLVELGLPEGEGKVSSPTLLRFASLVANTTHRIAG
jgi:positive regulator of sigma E activity